MKLIDFAKHFDSEEVCEQYLKESDLLEDEPLKRGIGSQDKAKMLVMDNLAAHSGVEAVTAKSEQQTVPGKDTPKVLPWVHNTLEPIVCLTAEQIKGQGREAEKIVGKAINTYCHTHGHVERFHKPFIFP